MNILRRSYLVLAIVFAVAGAGLCLRWDSSGLAQFVFILPALCFVGAFIFSAADKDNAVIHAIAVPVCVLALIIWGGVALILGAFNNATAQVTNVKKYEKILSEWSPGLVHHFPARIPAGAEDVRFSYQPGFMQGGAHIQLAYSTTSDTIAALCDEFSEMKTKSFNSGDTNGHSNVEEGMPTTFFFTNPTGEYSFPDNYEVMIFDRVLPEEERPEGHYFNHGQSHGVAISRKRNEIVYWAESW